MSGTIIPASGTTPIGFGADREHRTTPPWTPGKKPWPTPSRTDADSGGSGRAGASSPLVAPPGTSPMATLAGSAGAIRGPGVLAELGLGGLGRAAAGLLGSSAAAPLTAAAALFWPSRIGDGTLAARGLPPGGGAAGPGEGGFTPTPGALQGSHAESFPAEPEAGRPRVETFPADADRLAAALPGFTIARTGGLTVVQSTASKPSDGIAWPDKQLQRKFGKHAADFGVGGSYNPQTAGRFKQAFKISWTSPAPSRYREPTAAPP